MKRAYPGPLIESARALFGTRCGSSRSHSRASEAPVPGLGAAIRRAILLTAALAVVVGLAAGLGGGLLATRLFNSDENPAATVARTEEQIRSAVERVLPNVVLVLADTA